MKTIIGKHKAFLAAFTRCASITAAAKAAGIERTQHYDWLKTMPGYREEFEQATLEAAAWLEEEAIERAMKGVYEPNVYQGQFIYPLKGYEKDKDGEYKLDGVGNRIPIYGRKPLGVWKKSDQLLTMLLKRFAPHLYRDRVSAELTGKDGGPIPLEEQRLKALTDDELTNLLALAKKLTSDSGNGSGAPPTPAE